MGQMIHSPPNKFPLPPGYQLVEYSLSDILQFTLS